MGKTRLKIGFKKPKDFTKTERRLVVDEYLRSGLTKQAIWQKHTGQGQEHGYILRWMRDLGYEIPPRWSKLGSTNLEPMSRSKEQELLSARAHKITIAELQKALKESKLLVQGLETMITIAEEAYKIDIRKKYYTKQSIK